MGHRLLYTCEVDCIKEELEGEPEISDFVEIKTTDPIRDFRTRQFRHGFRQYMSQRWWSQCVMAGIEEIVVGIRDRRREFLEGSAARTSNGLLSKNLSNSPSVGSRRQDLTL